MPDALKSILVDDWEKVTKDQKLAPVPSPTPVTQFLNEYETSEMTHRRPNSADADILEEVVAGVKEYFNKSLGRILLYRFERQQFYEIHKLVEAGHGEHAGKSLADVYGCEHLLRLFGKLFSADAAVSITDLLSSFHARPHRSHQHGRAVCQPPTGRAHEDDVLAGEAARALSVERIPARGPGISGECEKRRIDNPVIFVL